jgi:hypothetical protein
MHRPVLLTIVAAGLMALVLSVPGPAPAADSMIRATAEAVLQPEGKKLYLATSSRSYQLAQYAYGRRVGTIVVDGEVRRRLRVSDDIGAETQPRGTVALAIHPITASGQFGALAASPRAARR